MNPETVILSTALMIAGTADRGASVKTSALKINADLGKPAIEIPESLEWRASPIAGVWRRMLDRDGDEVGQYLGNFFLMVQPVAKNHCSYCDTSHVNGIKNG